MSTVTHMAFVNVSVACEIVPIIEIWVTEDAMYQHVCGDAKSIIEAT